MVGRLCVLVSLAAAWLSGCVSPACAASVNLVEVIPISGPIDDGMAHMVKRTVHESALRHADGIMLEVNTVSGLVSSAIEIRTALTGSAVPIYAYVARRAWSAGALVVLSAAHISMAPDASMGAAQPFPPTPNTVSALRGEFEAAATRFHRDPSIAGAMVDAKISVPQYKIPGTILTLTADEARRAHLIDRIDSTPTAALANFGLRDEELDEAHYTLAESLARFATSPPVSAGLLALAFVGLLLEMLTLHGIAALLAAVALTLFFGTHLYAGFADIVVGALAVVGVLGILIELHVLPGRGVAGGLGLLTLVAAILLAFGPSCVVGAAQSLAVAIVLTVLVFVAAARLHSKHASLGRLVFAGVQGPDYVTTDEHRVLVGQTGMASSYLRPAGAALIGGRRVDVLTEGAFLSAGTEIRVSRVEGARIFVRPI